MCTQPSFDPVAELIPMFTLAQKFPQSVQPRPFIKVELMGGWWLVCSPSTGHPSINNWNVYPRIGLKGLSIWMQATLQLIPNATICFNLCTGSFYFAALSNSSGAYAQDLHRRDRLESFEKTKTGRDMLRILLPLNTFLARDFTMLFSTPFWAFSFYSFTLIISPSLLNYHSPYQYGFQPFLSGSLYLAVIFQQGLFGCINFSLFLAVGSFRASSKVTAFFILSNIFDIDLRNPTSGALMSSSLSSLMVQNSLSSSTSSNLSIYSKYCSSKSTLLIFKSVSFSRVMFTFEHMQSISPINSSVSCRVGQPSLTPSWITFPSITIEIILLLRSNFQMQYSTAPFVGSQYSLCSGGVSRKYRTLLELTMRYLLQVQPIWALFLNLCFSQNTFIDLFAQGLNSLADLRDFFHLLKVEQIIKLSSNHCIGRSLSYRLNSYSFRILFSFKSKSTFLRNYCIPALFVREFISFCLSLSYSDIGLVLLSFRLFLSNQAFSFPSVLPYNGSNLGLFKAKSGKSESFSKLLICLIDYLPPFLDKRRLSPLPAVLRSVLSTLTTLYLRARSTNSPINYLNSSKDIRLLLIRIICGIWKPSMDSRAKLSRSFFLEARMMQLCKSIYSFVDLKVMTFVTGFNSI